MIFSLLISLQAFQEVKYAMPTIYTTYVAPESTRTPMQHMTANVSPAQMLLSRSIIITLAATKQKFKCPHSLRTPPEPVIAMNRFLGNIDAQLDTGERDAKMDFLATVNENEEA